MHPGLEEPEHFSNLHASLNIYIRDWIVPRLPERYTALVEQGLSVASLLGRKRYQPDVRIDRVEAPTEVYGDVDVLDPPSFAVDFDGRPRRNLVIRDEDDNLVTTIETLSPANKSSHGFDDFRRKQSQLAERGVNLVEIDLLRKGKRRWQDDRVDETDYVMTVKRANNLTASVWAVDLGEALPTIPVPLLKSDPDIPLPLERIMREFLEKSGLRRRLGTGVRAQDS